MSRPTDITAQVAKGLTLTVNEAVAGLEGLDPAVAARRPGPGKWSIQEIIGHLVDSATNNHQRFVRAQLAPELVFPKYEQNSWVACQNYGEANWPELLGLWQLYNLHLAHVIRNLPAEVLGRECKIGDLETVTLLFLVEDYLGHLKHHLKKIQELVQ